MPFGKYLSAKINTNACGQIRVLESILIDLFIHFQIKHLKVHLGLKPAILVQNVYDILPYETAIQQSDLSWTCADLQEVMYTSRCFG